MDEFLPIGDGLPDAVKAGFLPHAGADGLGKALAFTILVPPGWRADGVPPVPATLPTDRMTPLALYANDPGEGCYLQVQAVRLVRDIGAEHWIRHFMLVSDYVPKAIRGLSPIFADALCTFAIEDFAFTGRITATLNGDILFYVFAFAPTATYPQWAERLGYSVASFEPSTEAAHVGVAPWVAHQVEAYRFQCPAGWAAYPAHTAPPGVSAVDLLYETDESPLGWIRFKTVSRDQPTSMEQLAERALADMEDTGVRDFTLRVDQGIELGDSIFTGGVLQMFDGASSTGLPQEIWVTLLEAPAHFVVVTLLTPARTADFRLWAENRRAYGIVAETLR
ncbi:MAG: hypothetical protein ACOVN0_01280 [Niveispirillum sp.]|uniref:hypothetical protein n=1 Tax=Niveispirillum sp. TaxID=1917217 RepID=UPI003BA815E4